MSIFVGCYFAKKNGTIFCRECVLVIDECLDPAHDKVDILRCRYSACLFLSVHPQVFGSKIVSGMKDEKGVEKSGTTNKKTK